MGALKKIGIIIAGIVGAVVILGVAALIALSAAVNSALDEGDLDAMKHATMSPEDREVHVRDMMDGNRPLNCHFLGAEDDMADDLLPLGALGLSRAEMSYYKDVRNFYQAHC